MAMWNYLHRSSRPSSAFCYLGPQAIIDNVHEHRDSAEWRTERRPVAHLADLAMWLQEAMQYSSVIGCVARLNNAHASRYKEKLFFKNLQNSIFYIFTVIFHLSKHSLHFENKTMSISSSHSHVSTRTTWRACFTSGRAIVRVMATA